MGEGKHLNRSHKISERNGRKPRGNTAYLNVSILTTVTVVIFAEKIENARHFIQFELRTLFVILLRFHYRFVIYSCNNIAAVGDDGKRCLTRYAIFPCERDRKDFHKFRNTFFLIKVIIT